MIPKFLYSLKSCPTCNKKDCDCFYPFNIIFYNNLKEIDFRNINNFLIINFSLKFNSTKLLHPDGYYHSNIFQNANSIQDIISIYNKFLIFQ